MLVKQAWESVFCYFGEVCASISANYVIRAFQSRWNSTAPAELHKHHLSCTAPPTPSQEGSLKAKTQVQAHKKLLHHQVFGWKTAVSLKNVAVLVEAGCFRYRWDDMGPVWAIEWWYEGLNTAQWAYNTIKFNSGEFVAGWLCIFSWRALFQDPCSDENEWWGCIFHSVLMSVL